MKKEIKTIFKNYPLIISILTFFFLLFPALFEPLSYGDECIYMTLGNAFRKGLVFYRDIHDNKPPLLYLLAALSFGHFYLFRLFAIVANLLHFLVIYLFLEKITPKKWLRLIASLLFVFLMIIFEGRVSNGEIFMTLPFTFAVYLLFTSPRKNDLKWGMILGVLASIGFLFKVPIAFDFLAVVFAFFFLPLFPLGKQKILSLKKNNTFKGILLGFVTPILLSIFYYSAKGAFTPYVRSALLQNIGYLSSWEGGGHGLLIRGTILLFLTGAIVFFRKKISFPLALFSLWFCFALFGALLSGRPYPHYLIEVTPPFVLLFATSIEEFLKTKKIFAFVTLGGAVFLFLFSYFHFHFWWYPQLPYYQNFLSFISRKINRRQYFAFWGNQVNRNYLLAKFIRESTTPKERIFVWGGEAACIYALSQRLPPGRYTVNYHIYDFNGY